MLLPYLCEFNEIKVEPPSYAGMAHSTSIMRCFMTENTKLKAWQKSPNNEMKNWLRNLLPETGMWVKTLFRVTPCAVSCGYTFFFPLGNLRWPGIAFNLHMTPYRHTAVLAGGSVLKIGVHVATYNLGSLYDFIRIHIYNKNDVPHNLSPFRCRY